MYPSIWKIELYYVFWGAALCGMVWWTERRAVREYGFADDDARSVLLWSMCGVFIGAWAGGYADKAAASGGAACGISALFNSGLSSGPAFIAGGLCGLYKRRRRALPVGRFADAAAIPAAFMIFVGRWGCFLQGCCVGLPTNSRLGVRFPFSHGVPLWPSQIFESAAGLAIGLLLIAVEKRRAARGMAFRGAVLLPVFLVLYGLYRVFFDFLRPKNGFVGFLALSTAQYSGIIAVVIGIFWFIRTYSAAARNPDE
ncbi:MAG: prolipoprotein diacylglyceryl transferase [Acidaminococcales bacterium]|jgi:phosphatidylglycerol:prolipoprotein diacylglycerol transferase|nr:prolipoprotein diacylglyceryl transferase [Acidaminococcales bacterium]